MNKTMISIPAVGECDVYYIPTVAYHLDDVPNEDLTRYMSSSVIGKAFDNDESDEFNDEAEATFVKAIDMIKSGDLKADYIDGFNPDNVNPDYDDFEIRYYDQFFMYMNTECIRVTNTGGFIDITCSTDFRAILYGNRWFFMYINDNPADQIGFPILMDIDAETATIDDVAELLLHTLPEKYQDSMGVMF